MGKISEFTAQDYEVIARDYADLKEAARRRCSDPKELEIIQKAFDFANEAHKGVRRRSGEPYILHPIAVAKIVVSNIGLGYKSIVAALLHDVVEDTDFSTTRSPLWSKVLQRSRLSLTTKTRHSRRACRLRISSESFLP